MSRTFIAGALLALLPAAAFAHAHLVSATPAVDATVKTAPTEVTIAFTEGVEPSYSGIVVLDAMGAHVETGAAHTAPGDNKLLAIAVKPLQPGAYRVQWHATAVDTHKTEGSYSFTVAFTVGG